VRNLSQDGDLSIFGHEEPNSFFPAVQCGNMHRGQIVLEKLKMGQ